MKKTSQVDEKSSGPVDTVFQRSEVNIRVIRGGKLVKEKCGWSVEGGIFEDSATFKNTTLRAGRRRIASALGGGLLNNTMTDAAVRQICWGIGGTDGSSNRIPVPDTISTFIGGSTSILEETTADASMAQGDEPAVIFHGALGYQSPANGNKITQIGLKLESGEFWAITTWKGFDKDSGTAFLINWRVYFL